MLDIQLLRKDAGDFVDSGIRLGAAPYLGPIVVDGDSAIQWIYEQRLLPEPVRQLLFTELTALYAEAN